MPSALHRLVVDSNLVLGLRFRSVLTFIGSGSGGWLWFISLVALVAGPTACGGSKSSGDNKAACLSCAMNACPTQAAACDASAGCRALRACSLACRMGDSACQNAC